MKMTVVLALVCVTFGLAVAQDSDAAVKRYELDIPQQILDAALKDLAQQTGLQIARFTDNGHGSSMVGPVRGDVTAETALDTLLASTGLEYSFINDRTVAVASVQKVAEAGGDSDPGNGPTAGATPKPVMMAQAVEEQSQTSRRTEPDSDEAEDERKRPLEEIIVTGTNIRGAAPVGSPYFQIDRDSIDRSGFSTTQQLISSLPQNFGGGANEDTLFGADARDNETGVSSVNLRGLGSDSTLVLVNGRRVPQGGGIGGNAVDISSIPLSAIDRVEVLIDGASSIYGSDSIAGVVNFILRDDFEGLETRLQYGTVTSGSLDEIDVAQSFGKTWETGNILVNYEYYNRDNLGYGERRFTERADLRPLGGDDFRETFSNPATITFPALAAIPPNQDGTSLSPANLIVGEANRFNQNQARDLLYDQERHTLFVTGSQEVSDSIELFGDFRYSHRKFQKRFGGRVFFGLPVTDNNPFFVTPQPSSFVSLNYNLLFDYGPELNTGDVDSYHGVLGATYDISPTWQFELYGAYGREQAGFLTVNTPNNLTLFEALGDFNGPFAAGTDNPDTSFNASIDGFFNPFGDGTNTPESVIDFTRGFFQLDTTASLWTVHGKADGEVANLPAGPIRFALGGEYREERFERADLRQTNSLEPVASDALTADQSRQVVAGFGEINIPIVGTHNARPGMAQMNLVSSVRVEHYSDFGTTVNHRSGIVWAPFSGLKLRGSYGTSFKAPRLSATVAAQQSALVFNIADPFAPDGSGDTFGLFLQGSNPDLGPEESTNWTAGLDFVPTALPELEISFTYYNIEFKNRIAQPDNVFNVFFEPDRFAPIITRDPDDALVQSFIDAPFFDPRFGVPDPSEVEAIVDGRLKNLSKTLTTGFDFGFRYSRDTSIGQISGFLQGNYILDFEEQFTTMSSTIELVDTVNNPTDLRLRGGVSWDNTTGLGATIYVNYLDSYTDDLSDPERKVDAWTTVDFNLRYNTGDNFAKEWARNLSVALSTLNLFDEDPPFVNNVRGVGYDPANADPLGRSIKIELRKQF